MRKHTALINTAADVHPEESTMPSILKLSRGTLAIIGMAALKAGRAIESVRMPEGKVSSNMMPRVNSSARKPRTKAFSTIECNERVFNF
jgi:hypothetical protein